MRDRIQSHSEEEVRSNASSQHSASVLVGGEDDQRAIRDYSRKREAARMHFGKDKSKTPPMGILPTSSKDHSGVGSANLNNHGPSGVGSEGLGSFMDDLLR